MVQQNQTSAKVDRQSIMLPWGAYESVKKLLDDWEIKLYKLALRHMLMHVVKWVRKLRQRYWKLLFEKKTMLIWTIICLWMASPVVGGMASGAEGPWCH